MTGGGKRRRMEFERFFGAAACTSFTEGKTRREMYECAGLAVKNIF